MVKTGGSALEESLGTSEEAVLLMGQETKGKKLNLRVDEILRAR